MTDRHFRDHPQDGPDMDAMSNDESERDKLERAVREAADGDAETDEDAIRERVEEMRDG